MMLAAFVMFLSVHARAQQGYAVLSADKTTLTFKYGTPTGTLNVDYYNTDDTGNTGLIGWARWRPLITTVVFDSSFASARPFSCKNWFNTSQKLTTIIGLEYLNTSKVTDMMWMFKGCSSLTNLDISHFDTSNVISMQEMFQGCSGLTSLDISHLDNPNVTNMGGMFWGCSSLPTLDLSSFGTSKVTDMGSMFLGCSSLTNLDVSHFDTSNVTDMGFMFRGCKSVPIIDVSGFDTSKAITMREMFLGCSTLNSLDVSGFDTSNVTNMYAMFHGCSSLTSLDVSGFNTSNVTNMPAMFMYCSGLTSLDVSHFDTSNAININAMFLGCSSLPTLDVSGFNTSSVTNMGFMFSGCSSLTSLDVSGFNTSSVTDMGSMFGRCELLTSLDVSGFDTSSVTYIDYMFGDCSSLLTLDVSGFNTSNVIYMDQMFAGCSSLTNLDVSGFDTSNVTSMGWMFAECSSLTSLTFGKDFNTKNLLPPGDDNGALMMFYNSEKLRYIDFYASDDTDVITAVEYDEPSDISTNIDFSGVPATTVIFLPHGSQEVTNVQNVVYSYGGDETDLRSPKYYSVDKVDIEFPHTFKTNEAVYSRTMGSKEYGSVILPYDFTSNSDIQAYSLSEQNQSMTSLKFTNVQTVPAHTPFAFKRLNNAEFLMTDDSSNFGITVHATRSTNAAEKTWSATDEKVSGSPYEGATGLSNWKTKGYYVKETVTDYDGMYFIQDDDFKRAVGNLNLVDHRVLFYPTDTTGTAKFFTLSFSDDEMVTAIEAAETEQTLREATGIYDASGRQQTTVRKGLNIVRMSDGSVKKVIIK